MQWLSLVLPALLLTAAGLIEMVCHRRRLRRIPIRILVNGTRGKTSITRQTAAALNAGGIRTVAKCTGSDPIEILPDGGERPTLRPHGARISELRGFVRRAAEDGAEAIVVECMAVQPETQRALSRQLVRPGIVIISNTLVDHVEELGRSEEETARGLSFSLYGDCTLVSDSPHFAYWPNREGSDSAPLPDGYLAQFNYPVFEQNIRLALKMAEICGVPREKALQGILAARPDVGMAGPFVIGGSLVVNAFAANDAASTASRFRDAWADRQGREALVILYNHRADRAYRMKSFLPFLKELAALRPRLMTIGERPQDAARYFSRRLPYPVQALDGEALLSGAFYAPRQLVFCMGNIKGEGDAMIRYCLARDEGTHAS